MYWRGCVHVGQYSVSFICLENLKVITKFEIHKRVYIFCHLLYRHRSLSSSSSTTMFAFFSFSTVFFSSLLLLCVSVHGVRNVVSCEFGLLFNAHNNNNQVGSTYKMDEFYGRTF